MAKWARENGYTMVIVVDQGRTQGAGAVEQSLESQNPGLNVVIEERPLS